MRFGVCGTEFRNIYKNKLFYMLAWLYVWLITVLVSYIISHIHIALINEYKMF